MAMYDIMSKFAIEKKEIKDGEWNGDIDNN